MLISPVQSPLAKDSRLNILLKAFLFFSVRGMHCHEDRLSRIAIVFGQTKNFRGKIRLAGGEAILQIPHLSAAGTPLGRVAFFFIRRPYGMVALTLNVCQARRFRTATINRHLTQKLILEEVTVQPKINNPQSLHGWIPRFIL